MHVDAAVAPAAVEYFPAPQLVHVEDAAAVWYFPFGHAVHEAADAAEKRPAAHAVLALAPVTA